MSSALHSKAVKVALAQPHMTPPTPRPVSAAERLARGVTRPYVAFSLTTASLALLAWSLLVRLPGGGLPVRARELHSVPASNTIVTVEAVAELESNARLAARQLIRERDEIARTLSKLEQAARALGFKVDVSMKPALTNAAGFKELTIHPAVIHLENDYTRDEPAFERALDWLRHPSTFARKIDVPALKLRSHGEGLARAEVELHFWSITDHEKPAPK